MRATKKHCTHANTPFLNCFARQCTPRGTPRDTIAVATKTVIRRLNLYTPPGYTLASPINFVLKLNGPITALHSPALILFLNCLFKKLYTPPGYMLAPPINFVLKLNRPITAQHSFCLKNSKKTLGEDEI